MPSSFARTAPSIGLVMLAAGMIGAAHSASAQPIPPRDAEIRRDQAEHRRIEDERSIERHRHWDNRHHRYIYEPGYYPPPPPPVYAVPAQPAYAVPGQPVYVMPAQPTYVAPAPATGLDLNLNFR